jgi:hypothetical protein
VPLVETKGLNLIHKTEKEPFEASQITESFSYSTATTTTTTITEMKEEEDEAMSKRSRLNRAEARGPRKRLYTGELSGRRNIPARGPSEVRTRGLTRAPPEPGKIPARGPSVSRDHRLNPIFYFFLILSLAIGGGRTTPWGPRGGVGHP